jgi:hypothetical protein
MANKGNSPGKKGMNMWANDPMMKNLWEGKMSWANVMEKYDPNAFKPKGSPANNNNTVRIPSWVPEHEYFQNRVGELLTYEDHDSYTGSGWQVPNLKLRKSIWENFPVVLKPIHSGNGTDRYAITWHIQHLEEWRDSTNHALSFNEHNDYEIFTEYKLLYALSQHPKQYVLEPPRSEDQIAIIAMVHNGPRNGNNGTRKLNKRNASRNNKGNKANRNNRNTRKANKTNKANRRNVPVLKSLNDIKALFPVVWHEVEGKAGTKTYALEFHKKNLREMATTTGKSAMDITHALMAALQASTFWNVLPPSESSSICRLEMIAKK